LLNDDVEVLSNGWDIFYPTAFEKTDYHHLIYTQAGVYGAQQGRIVNHGSLDMRKLDDKPHGAVLAFTNKMLSQCGYFNTDFGKYGMEHVDWSMKAFEFGLQETGFYDVEGSQDYFKVHRDNSMCEDRVIKLNQARKKFANRSKERLDPDPGSKVPEITYVIPFRNTGREDAIVSVINGVRAQRFPVIHIIAVEQDIKTKVNTGLMQPVSYYLAKENKNLLFNKSMAFNLGVSKSPCPKVILHDADMVVPGSYTNRIANILRNNQACHIGKTVIYSSKQAAAEINKTGIIDDSILCDRVVGYYEGGSLAVRTDAYWSIGGFNEDFWGYGVEDCEFYARLSKNTKWFEDRCVDLFHLWHSRVSGWDDHHNENKKLGKILSAKKMPERIKKQIQQAKKLGYGPQIDKAIKNK
jgi:hypothetical protein